MLVTAAIVKEELDRLSGVAEVTSAGWGVTGVLLDEEELRQKLVGQDVLVVGYEKVSLETIEFAKDLKLIACTRSNPVSVDIDAATARGIPVIYAPGRNSNSTADFTMGLILAETRNIARVFHRLKEGEFLGPAAQVGEQTPDEKDVVWGLSGDTPYKIFKGFEFDGRTLGLIGFGDIASRVAVRAQAFGMQVISTDPYCPPERARAAGVELVPLDRLLEASDFISIHCKVTAETTGLIGRREIRLMKPTAYLINTARAVVVDETALVEALQERRIRGAALDVYWREPLPANHPLLQLDNVTLTPHLAGASLDVGKRHSEMVVSDILAWFNGLQPSRVRNAAALGGVGSAAG